MTKIYAIQTGQTTWEQQSRVESSAGAPLTDEGTTAVEDAARQLPGQEIKAVYVCTAGEAERQTAELLAKTLKAKIRNNEGLHELDYGLWQGLTVDEIKRRQPRAYRQWTRCPASTRPPQGETLAEAQDRLRSALKEIAKRHKNGSALLVLRPVLMGLLKCLSRHEAVDGLWRHVDQSLSWDCYELDDKTL